MRYISFVLISFIFSAGTLNAGGTKFFSLSQQFKVSEGQTAVVAMPRQSSVAIIGPLNKEVLAKFRELNANNSITTLYIDSGGGDVASAIELAKELRKKEIRVVVAGRCFSACANYIFTAAIHKDVLPGSLLGIHGLRFNYYGKDQVHTESSRDQNKLLLLGEESKIRDQLSTLSKVERVFYLSIGIKKDYYDAFENYEVLSGKDHRIHKPRESCPQIDVWILSREDLGNIGITGMGAIWAPESKIEAQAAANSLGLKPSQIYFGSRAQLLNMCRTGSISEK